ncbi:hypothetical protein LJC23_03790 [Desulfovibrio sp. OttesenSCG-928-I05]|nr:hypothetical protein [Desulfovibrio sp. OttesenSCG-928-I05]
MRDEGVPVLAIAGPGEFLADRYAPPKKPYDAKLLASVQSAAINATDWDCVYVSAKASAWLQENGAPLPDKGTLVTSDPRTEIFSVAGKNIAVIFLPPGSEPNGMPSEDQINDALDTGRDARSRSDLVIAVSPWGMHAELNHAARFEGVFHMLLGGGPGMGIAPQVIHAAPAVLWGRAESLGRALMLVEVMAWPDPAMPTAWMESVNFSWRELTLGLAIDEDPAVSSIIAAVPHDAE